MDPSKNATCALAGVLLVDTHFLFVRLVHFVLLLAAVPSNALLLALIWRVRTIDPVMR